MTKMIIALNQFAIETARRGILTLVENINRHLSAWDATGLPAIKPANLGTFAADPNGYFDNALTVHAEGKGMNGVVPREYARLFNITFVIDLGRYPMDMKFIDYVKMTKGTVAPVPDYMDRIQSEGVVTVSDPAQIAAAEIIMDVFTKYTYVANMLKGGGNGILQLSGIDRIGFSALTPGHLSAATVEQLAKAMESVPLDEWKSRLVETYNLPVNEPEPAAV